MQPELTYQELLQDYSDAQRKAIRYSVIHHPDAESAREDVENLRARIQAVERTLRTGNGREVGDYQ